MPILIGMLIVALLFAGITSTDLEYANGMTKSEYAQKCTKEGGVVLEGLTTEGSAGVGCYKINNWEIKL